MSLMVQQCRAGFCIALGLIQDPISEQVTPCQRGDGWDMNLSVQPFLARWKGSTHSGHLQVPSAPCPRKTYPSFMR